LMPAVSWIAPTNMEIGLCEYSSVYLFNIDVKAITFLSKVV